MKLNVSDLLSEEVVTKDINVTVEEKGFYDGSEYIKLLEPLKFSGTLSKEGDILLLEGRINTLLELTCSRCLGKFSYAVNVAITERFTNNNKENKDDEAIFIDSNIIDITEIIENNIILILPIKRLCSENCKGLCQQCGTNLNNSKCQCKSDDIDPRLAKLKDMFFTD
ncbi:YceD family protein [Clostridium coskatii]|uniref:Large ribosomal RNA subunit accumulation protein YceD n=1 Tax=Clostridium coskatii TaxID=1705578 RepID=A0A166TYZ5_9CLOT|nr:DUF177 domain-containing protein [Clostridium coskatii]OAA94366.1 hypothetical protein WX73_02912 [Clostridium coskatii]OBR93110.1 hypothetical protein CLCOS_25820 [Clostridium coskatii]